MQFTFRTEPGPRLGMTTYVFRGREQFVITCLSSARGLGSHFAGCAEIVRTLRFT